MKHRSSGQLDFASSILVITGLMTYESEGAGDLAHTVATSEGDTEEAPHHRRGKNF